MVLDRIQTSLFGTVVMRPGERTRTLLVTVYLFLVIAIYIAVKAIRDSLFLDKFGALKLPYVIIGIALGIGLFVAVYIRLARRLSPTVLVLGTVVLFSSNLLMFWWLARLDVPWLYPLIYIWAGMFGAIAPTQVWTLANDVFTTRQAKRTFGLIGSGGILGAIVGGWVGTLSLRIGTINLLPILAGAELAAGVVVIALSRYRLPKRIRVEDFPEPRHLRDSLGLIRHSTHLKLIAGLVFITALSTTTADWQFKAVVSDALTGDRLTAFFGAFYGSVGILSFVVQFLITSRMLRQFGLGVTILVLPVALFASTVLLIPTLAVWAASLLKGSDSSLKHSIDRSSRELAYLPVRRGIKIHVKSAIDMVVDRFGDGTAGVMLLVLASFLGLGVAPIGFINLGIIVLWITMAVRLRRSYGRELAASIAEGNIEVASWHEALAGAETLGTLRRALESEDEPRILAALQLASGNPTWDLAEPLRKLARQGSPEVRARAMAILLRPEEPGLPEGIGDSFQEEDQSLLAECVDVMVARDPVERARMAEAILRRAGGETRGAWLALMVRRLGPEFEPVSRSILNALADPISPALSREAAATAIGLVPRSAGMEDLLPRLLEDRDPRVASAAARSAGAIADDGLMRRALALLGKASTRPAAELAFRSRGDESLPILLAAAEDDETAQAVRRNIPGVLGHVGSQRALNALVGLLEHDESWLSEAAATALYRYRQTHPGVTLVPPRTVRMLVMRESGRYHRLKFLESAVGSAAVRNHGDVARILLLAMEESRQARRAAIFRILCLYFPPVDIRNAEIGLLDDDGERRGNAAELLDNLTSRALWRQLVPILYPETIVEMGAEPSAATVGLGDTVVELAGDEDPWVRSCALRLAATLSLPAARSQAGASVNHWDPRVRDAAAYYVGRIEGTMQPSETMGILEKVVALRKVDVFEGTPTEQLSLIAALARPADVNAGEVVYRQDDPPGDLFVILDGRVILERDGKTLGSIGSGEALGTWALFEDEPRQATARAETDVAVLRIDRWGFDELLMEHPELSRVLVRQMVRRVRSLAGAGT